VRRSAGGGARARAGPGATAGYQLEPQRFEIVDESQATVQPDPRGIRFQANRRYAAAREVSHRVRHQARADAVPAILGRNDEITDPRGAEIVRRRHEADALVVGLGNEASIRIVIEASLEQSGRRVPAFARCLGEGEFDITLAERVYRSLHAW
jgi:hypothetical protein